ncbi:MAG: carbonic anhydrase [Candidatus Methanomethylophilaceae archaeon]|jgi:carbonic anhydrase
MKVGKDAVDELLEYNREFVKNERYKEFKTTKYPDRKIAILTCMDTRLTNLLPAALGLKNGEVKMIKNAGGIISDPFGSSIKSLLVGIYELGVEEIMVIGHTDCGAQHICEEVMEKEMLERGIPERTIELLKGELDFHGWLSGFDSVEGSVINTVKAIREHPLVPKDVDVSGFLIDSHTGELTVLDRS